MDYAIDVGCLPRYLNPEAKDDDEKYAHQRTFDLIYNKVSLKVFPKFIRECLTLFRDHGKEMRYIRWLLKNQGKVAKSVTSSSFSKQHATARKNEMRAYWKNQAEKIAGREDYIELIQKNVHDQLGIDEKDLVELRKSVAEKRARLNAGNNKVIVPGKVVASARGSNKQARQAPN